MAGNERDLRTAKSCRKLPCVKLSILMPVYNELATLESAVKRVLDVDYPVEVELVIVDDGSTDGTRTLYQAWEGDSRVQIHLKASNGGKEEAQLSVKPRRDLEGNFIDVLRGKDKAVWRSYSAINPGFAECMDIEGRASRQGHDFSFRTRAAGLQQRLNMITGVEFRGATGRQRHVDNSRNRKWRSNSRRA